MMTKRKKHSLWNLGNWLVKRFKEYVMFRFVGSVFYDSEKNRFLQLRKRKRSYLVFGDSAEYFSDAQTTLSTQQLSYEYAKKLVPVAALDKMKGVYYSDLSWRVGKETRSQT